LKSSIAETLLKTGVRRLKCESRQDVGHSLDGRQSRTWFDAKKRLVTCSSIHILRLNTSRKGGMLPCIDVGVAEQ
jgi:hypothetical protein